ncbi:MAG: hypothetical protein QNJ97_15620 [Myxococcota bacterium]|nr:hypothetical protein [Myxococcota bacterium]
MTKPETPSKNWTVAHDETKCALCVVCARNCPTAALRRDEEGDNLALYFNSGLCDGCGGNALCEQNCPESAIQAVEQAGTDEASGFVLLSQSKMAQCDYCDEYFAPVRRLDVISNKHQKKGTVERTLCPICRRSSLVVDYIEQHRVPGSKAEYRSARDITRRANKRMKMEEGMRRR